jgi:hypothetical protein
MKEGNKRGEGNPDAPSLKANIKKGLRYSSRRFSHAQS